MSQREVKSPHSRFQSGKWVRLKRKNFSAFLSAYQRVFVLVLKGKAIKQRIRKRNVLAEGESLSSHPLKQRRLVPFTAKGERRKKRTVRTA